MNPERFQVLVAGGGIAGLSAALAFRKTGFKVTVLEQAAAFAPVGAGILLQANGLMVLDLFGLGEQVRTQGTAMPRILLRDARGRCLAASEFQAHLPRQYWPICIHRAHLHDILWRACVGAGVETRFGWKAKDLHRTELAQALVCDTPEGLTSIAGDLIVGADGVRSTVREIAGIPAHLWPIVEGSVQGVLPRSVQSDWHGEYLKGPEACGMLPMGPNATFWFWGGSDRTAARLEAREFDGWKADIGRRFPAMDTVLAGYSSWAGMVRLQHRSVRCDAWSAGNIVLIGDAAHAMSPNLGQGANCALVDALALAGHVAAANPDRDLSGALAAFEHDRRPLVDGLQRRGHDEGTSASRRWRGADAIINLMLRLSRFFPSGRQRADILAMGGLDGTGFHLSAAGVRMPPPW